MRSVRWFVTVSSVTLLLAACGDDVNGPGGGGSAGEGGGSTTSQGGGSTTSGGGGSTTSQGGGSSEGGGGSSSEGGGGAASDVVTAFCEMKVAHEEECDPGNVDTLDECLADEDTTCFSNIRPEVQQPLIDCLEARSCNQSEDACYYEVGAADPTEGQEEYLDGCAVKLAACPDEFSDDFCAITILTTERYTALGECMSLECAEVKPCLDAVIDDVCSE